MVGNEESFRASNQPIRAGQGNTYRASFKSLVEKLTMRFEPKGLQSMYQKQLRVRRRKHKKSIPELVQEIGKLTRKSFPGSDEQTRDYMSVTSCLSALNNEVQEMFVYQKDPKTLEEAGTGALAFENFQASHPKVGGTLSSIHSY